MTRGRPLLLGHRGARAVPFVFENTLAAFDLCLQHGCDGFEFDVRATADGIPVVCHDPELRGQRLAAVPFPGLKTLRSEGLLPTLEEVLARYRTAFLDIELKEAGLERETLRLLREYWPERGFVLSSFLPDVLLHLRALDRDVPLGFIFDEEAALPLAGKLPLQFLMPERRLAGDALTERAHERDQLVFVWTVNSSEEMQRLAELNVDGIISDETNLLVESLKGK